MSFIAQALNAFSQGCMTFTGQNFGSNKIDRVKKVYRYTLLINGLLGLLLGIFIIIFGQPLLKIYTPDSEASVAAGMIGLTTVMAFAFLMGFQDACGMVLRGLNYSVFPMITALFANCVFRIFWILVVFHHFAPTMETLEAYQLLVSAYPISWIMIFVANNIAYMKIIKNI